MSYHNPPHQFAYVLGSEKRDPLDGNRTRNFWLLLGCLIHLDRTTVVVCYYTMVYMTGTGDDRALT